MGHTLRTKILHLLENIEYVTEEDPAAAVGALRAVAVDLRGLLVQSQTLELDVKRDCYRAARGMSPGELDAAIAALEDAA